MSEVNKMAAKTVEIKNYTVPVRYFTRASSREDVS